MLAERLEPTERPINVLVILGHPRADSLCGALAEAFCQGARAGALTLGGSPGHRLPHLVGHRSRPAQGLSGSADGTGLCLQDL